MIIESLPRDVERQGLTGKALLMDAERRLKKAGIHVLTPNESTEIESLNLFDINVTAMNHEQNQYTILIKVSLYQDIELPKNPSFKGQAPTWIAELLGTESGKNLSAVIVKTGKLIDDFIHDYKLVNTR